jgi:membrane associated rhomboid family serine protease
VFLPIGLDETRLSRLPWVSITLLALNVLAFAATAASSADDELESRFDELVAYWSERPHLELPEELGRRFDLDADRLAELTGVPRPAGAAYVSAAEQEELESRSAALLEAHDATPARRFGLVPERGLAQPGWLTHLFMHGGLGHLLGNMLVFFLVVAPFLEDAWGRPFFLAFYLLGGLAAGAAQALPALDSGVPIVGASGAISACLGAFALRFAHRRVRIFYWLWIIVRGTFFVPVWAYALFGLAMDLFGLWAEGASGGIAYGAHVGGFVFGLGVAVALRSSGLEARLAPDGAVGAGHSMATSRAAEALADGRTTDARDHFAAALRKDPDDPEALLGLARLAAAAFDRAAATAHAERLLTRLAPRDPRAARAMLVELAPALDAEAFRPAQAYRAAELLGGEDPALADRLDEVAARAGGAVAAKALLRAAERVRAADPALALERARRAAAVDGAPPELVRRAEALVEGLRAAAPAALVAPPDPHAPIELPEDVPPGAGGRFAGLELPDLAEPPGVVELADEGGAALAALLDPSAPVRLVHCRLVGGEGTRLALATGTGTGTRTLPAERVAGLAAGVLAEHGAGAERRRNAVLLDLLLRAQPGETGRVVVRIPGHAMALAALHPGVPPHDAFGRVVDALLGATGAPAAPSPSEAAGRPFARFADAEAFELATWGRRLSA